MLNQTLIDENADSQQKQQLDALSQYLINESDYNVQSSDRKYFSDAQQSEIFFCLYGLFYVEFVMCSAIVLSNLLNVIEDYIVKYTAYVFLILSSIFISCWSGLAVKKKYVELYWGLVWVNYAIIFFASVVLLQLGDGINCVWLICGLFLAKFIAQVYIKRQLFIIWSLLYCDISLLGFVMLLIQFQKHGRTQVNCHNALLFYIPSCGLIIALLCIILIIQKTWRFSSKVQKVYLLSYIYIYFLAENGCIGVMLIYFQLNFVIWPVLTAINHAIFIFIIFHINKHLIPSKKISTRIKSIILRKMQHSQKAKFLYPISSYLFSYQKKEILCLQKKEVKQDRSQCKQEPNKQNQQKNCIICLCSDSELCFQQCLHACVCLSCAIEVLKRPINKCPLCLAKSSCLLRFCKYGPPYEILAKYKILSQSQL